MVGGSIDVVAMAKVVGSSMVVGSELGMDSGVDVGSALGVVLVGTDAVYSL